MAVCPIDLITAIPEYNNSGGVPFADSYKAEVRHETIHQRPQLTVEYVEPGNETEKKLADVWRNFLGIQCVGIYDNFFELGATSLDLIQVNGRLIDELKKDIPFTPEIDDKILIAGKSCLESLNIKITNINKMDGIRFDYKGGWILIRRSGTSPYLRISGESTESMEKSIEMNKNMEEEMRKLNLI